MKIYKNISILLLFNLVFLCCQAQSKLSSDSLVFRRSTSTVTLIKSDNSKDRITRDLIIEPTLIQNMDVLSKTAFQKNYTSDTADTYMVVTLKPNVELLSLHQIFEKFDVNKDYWGYQVLVDNTETENSKSLLSTSTAIKKVNVNSEAHIINIVTVFNQKYLDFRKRVKASKSTTKRVQ